jgi:hypothetical protein
VSADDERWLRGLADGVWGWLSGLRAPGRPGWVRLCREGALVEPGPRAGLGVSCLALKTCAMLGLLPRLEPGEAEGWVRHIRSFQAESGRSSGFFEDPTVTRPADRKAGWFRRDVKVRLAETRQACAALMTVGSAPLHPVSRLPGTPEEARAFVAALDWDRPWDAGSHAGHLLFFYGLSCAEGLSAAVLSELDKRQDPATGAWFAQRPGMEQLVNGAMKVLTGYAALGKPFARAERLIDTCLEAGHEEHACNNADVVYVLSECARRTGHRRREVEDYLVRRLAVLRRFQRPDGGFSFYPDGAQDHYYGARVSRRLPESDVHGTTLFAWTLAMIGDTLGWNRDLGWRLPVT